MIRLTQLQYKILDHAFLNFNVVFVQSSHSDDVGLFNFTVYQQNEL